jgi:hypothetical protein
MRRLIARSLLVVTIILLLPTGAYYPTVQGCAEPWIKVAPMAE